MKKLLFTFVGAAAFAALAADPSAGANDIDVLGFENFDLTQTATVTGAVVDRNDSGVTGQSKWLATGEDASLVKTYGGDNAAKGSGLSYPAPFSDEGDQYLALDTNGSELQRYFDTDTTNGTPTAVAAGGTYVDTLVQFTPSESAPNPEDLSGAKLAIWLGVDAANNTTNLYVQGAYYDTVSGLDLNATSNQAYKLNKSCDPGTWYRLTVKAIATIGNAAAVSAGERFPGFVIMIDGEEIATSTAVYSQAALTQFFAPTAEGEGGADDYLDADNLALLKSGKFIPSLDSQRDPATLTSVGFKGTGALDDFVVTETAPEFAPSAISLTLTWTAAEVTAVSYVLESDPATTNVVTSGTAVSIPAAAIGTNVTLIATFESGYEFDYLDIGGYHLESLTFPVPPISTNATLVAKTAAAYPTYVGEDAALKSQYDTWKATNGADSQSAYEKQFLLNVAPGTTVADDALVIESITENETAGWDIVVSTSVSGAALSDGSDTTYNGYLLVKSANDLAGLATATPVAYTVNAVTGGKVSITVTAGKFMKVVLTTTAPAQN